MTRIRPHILVVFVLAVSLSGTSNAQLRSVPADAMAGEIRQLQDMTVVVADRTTLRLAIGAQIRDAENRIVLPGSLASGTIVLYQLDANGEVRRAWIPSDAEAALISRPSAPQPYVPLN